VVDEGKDADPVVIDRPIGSIGNDLERMEIGDIQKPWENGIFRSNFTALSQREVIREKDIVGYSR
jgi:hypothetical protein